MASRLISDRLIGRVAELAELEAALEEAAERRPSIAFVAGESGVGKTRLLDALEHTALERGARVLGGASVDLGEDDLPYAPLVSALRPLVRDADPALHDLPPVARSALATLLPELGPAPPVRSEEERGSAQRRLFEALLALLERLGSEDPVLLIIEDVHWADRSTRSFIAFLANEICRQRLLTVASYRSDELHRRHPLRPLLAELERDPRARRLELARFDRDELAAQLEEILGAAPQPELVDRMFRRSEGNPLFTEELLAGEAEGGRGLPPTLRDALMLRIERLPARAQEVLRPLAAAQRIDHALLADAAGLDPRELREAVREAVAGQIVVADAEGRYAFRHALLAEVVYDDLLPGERAEVHLGLAAALERRADSDGGAWTAASVAHHYRAAGDQPSTLRASVRAAAEAERLHAEGEAAALLERALELWDRVPDAAALAGADRAEILSRAARAHQADGDDTRCATLCEQALAELDPEREPRRVAAVLGELAGAQWSLGRGEASRATLERALALLPAADGASVERARLLDRQVQFLMLQGRYRRVLPAADEALAVAEAAGAEAVRGTVLNRLGVALLALGEADAGVAALAEAIELARLAGAADDLSTAFVNLADSLHNAGRSEEAQGAVLAAQQEVRAGNRSARWLAITAAQIDFDLGHWEEAAAQLPESETRLAGSALANANLRRAELALGLGDDDVARPLLDETEALIADSIEPQFIGVTGVLRAELERRAGDLPAARSAVDDALDRLEFCTEDLAQLARVTATGVAVEADAAQRARDLGDDATEREAIARAASLLERTQAAAADEGPVEDAHRVTAEAEAARAADRDDPCSWAAAAGAWEQLGRPYPAALARWRETEARVAESEHEAAVLPARSALAAAHQLGARRLTGEIEHLVARARLQLDDAPAAAPPPDEPEDPFGLTPRERQVLLLLARGATNREIGAELYMAEKTASVHVSRILGKLAVRRRTEAAAVAHRHGLTD